MRKFNIGDEVVATEATKVGYCATNLENQFGVVTEVDREGEYPIKVCFYNDHEEVFTTDGWWWNGKENLDNCRIVLTTPFEGNI